MRSIFPLRVVSGERYLVDAAGKPFLIQGDSPWTLAVRLTTEDADRYLEARRRDGFNAILFDLVAHDDAVSNVYGAAKSNAYGEAPFLRVGDFGSPNPRYFDHVAEIISRARDKGMLVLLVPADLGFQGGNQGWWSEMKANGAAKLREYGRYVATRYRPFDNVLWVEGGDFSPPAGARGLVDAVANGIRSVTPSLQTFHGGRGTSALAYWQPRPQWLSVNAIYTDSATVVARAASSIVARLCPSS